MKKIMCVFGTRPEAIKMAPLVLALKKEKEFDTKVILTAQHREMLDQVMEFFDISADYDLNIMTEGQSLYSVSTKVLTGIGKILQTEKPDLILVHGDTTTTFMASLAAFYEKIPIGHIEAGLRSYDKHNPFPEEINRLLTDGLCDLYFAPTTLSKKNLLKENIESDSIFVTGNTVIDALLYVSNHLDRVEYSLELLKEIGENQRFILATVHRRENWGEPLVDICNAFNKITEENDIKIILPVHPNPNVKKTVQEILGNNKDIYLVPHFSYIDFVALLKRAYLVLTDSGGLQEEAPALGKPVLVLRKTTERPEAAWAGTAKVVATDTTDILNITNKLLNNENEYKKMANAVNPYGDGHAAARTIKAIKWWFKLSTDRIKDWHAGDK